MILNADFRVGELKPPTDKTDERLNSILKSISGKRSAGEFESLGYDSADPIQELADLIKKEYGDIPNPEIAKLMSRMFPGTVAEMVEQELFKDDFGSKNRDGILAGEMKNYTANHRKPPDGENRKSPIYLNNK